MNPFESQTDILNELAQIIHNEVNSDYEAVTCEYNFISRYNTISSSFRFVKNGEQYNKEMSPGVPTRNAELAFELRALMKAHTGGEWTSFTLTLDKDGKAHTKFHYPEAKPE